MPWAYLLRRVMGGETEGLALRACLAGVIVMIPDFRRFVNTAEDASQGGESLLYY